MRSTFLLLSVFLSSLSSVAQTHFYLDEPFKHPVNVPSGLVSLLREEIKQACGGETNTQSTDVKSWFSASRININNHSSAFMLKSGKYCLTGADNNWFWVYLKTPRGYRLVLTGGTISLDVLQTKTHGLRDIETNMAAGQTNYMTIYKYDGSVYKARICTEEAMQERNPKPHRVPCRR